MAGSPSTTPIFHVPHNSFSTAKIDLKISKISLPPFDGSNPLDWLFQADQYFTYYNISPPKVFHSFLFFMKGSALGWYK